MITIVLLSCSISSYSQNNTSSTGGGDSVAIAFDDLRIANVKMTQLIYEREKVRLYQQMLRNDSIVINKLLEDQLDNTAKVQVAKQQRNYALLGDGILAVVLILLIAL